MGPTQYIRGPPRIAELSGTQLGEMGVPAKAEMEESLAREAGKMAGSTWRRAEEVPLLPPPVDGDRLAARAKLRALLPMLQERLLVANRESQEMGRWG